MARRSGRSSKRWLREHFKDEYVQRSWRDGYRSRAVYKLQEIQEKDRLLTTGMTVIDLGAAPGGWSQYAAQCVGSTGKVIALDILPMVALADVTVIQGDFREQETLAKLLAELQNGKADLVISDMAPNTSGIKAVDQPRAMYLAELTVDLVDQCLKPGGDLLFKVFQGEGFEQLLQQLRPMFTKVVSRKPKASRARSTELYLLARNYRL